MTPQQVSNIQSLLAQPKKIVVVGHKNPDGDAVGSCLALNNFLNQLGHHSTVVMPNDFPDFLKWIPENENIVIYEKNPPETRTLIKEANLVFTLDFNALNRTGDLESLLKKATADFVMIDHHQQPDDYAIVTYSDVAMCSTSQMVYHFIESLNQLKKLNKNIATQLYTGIMTDTGSFRYPSTTAVTHRVVAHLIEHGANSAEIHQNVYDTNTPNRIKLLGTALNNLSILEEYKTAFITLTQNELDEHQFKKGDAEGFVNYALSVKGIVFAAIFIENKQENIVKISFRSKGSFSVNEFARNHFNGGGHTNAAGGRSDEPLKETISKFIAILPRYKDALIHA